MNPYLAIEGVLSEDEKRRITEVVTERNLHLRGAPVADLLDITRDADGALDWTEPFYEQNEATVATMVHSPVEPLFAVAVLAAALVKRGVPTAHDVMLLVNRAGRTLSHE